MSAAKFDAAKLDARLTTLGLSTQDAAEMFGVKPATMAAWRSGDKQPSAEDRIQLRLVLEEGRTHAVEMIIGRKRNTFTLSRNGEGADHSGVTPRYAGGYEGEDGNPVPTVPALPEIDTSNVQPQRDLGPQVKS